MAKTSSSIKTNKKLRVAIIGAGFISNSHLKEYVKRSDVEIVALADPKKDPMMKWADLYKIPTSRCFSSDTEMLAAVRPDAVSVCSSNGAHEENTIAALNAGAHVLVEKPMAMNAKQAANMVKAAQRNRRKLVIGFQQRYDTKTDYLNEAVKAGVFGDVLYGRVQALRRRGIPNWGVFGQKHLQGGGPMIDIGVHMLECCHFTMGSPRPVAAFGNTYMFMGNKPSKIRSTWPNWDYKTYTVEDMAVGMIRFDNGAMLSIEASFVAHIEKDIFNFSLAGTKGGGNWDSPAIYTDQVGHQVNMTPAYIAQGGWDYIWAKKIALWVDHALYDAPTVAPAEHGLMVQKMLDGIYASAAKGGREVAIR